MTAFMLLSFEHPARARDPETCVKSSTRHHIADFDLLLQMPVCANLPRAIPNLCGLQVMRGLQKFSVFFSLLGAVALSPAGGTINSAAAQSAAQLLGEFGSWGAYTAAPGGKKICFALAKPAESETNPPNRPRDPAWLFVSTRPAEKVREEVSVIFGYPLKSNTDATIEIGSTNFAMYTQNDGAWVKNAAEEARLVDAMRKGSEVTVRGESGRGTKTIDKFSLKGVVQALDRAASECR
jgi:invasion protein IalB